MVIGQVFQKVLVAYQNEHDLSEVDMAQVAGVTRDKMRSWLRGGQPRHKRDIEQACERLGIDPESILNPNVRYLGVGFSFKTLQTRFSERIQTDPRAVFEIVILAGAAVHTRLINAGLPFTSTTLPTGQVVMHAAQDAHLGKVMVSLQWNETAIILMVAAPGSPPLLSEPLSEDTFKRAIEILSQ